MDARGNNSGHPTSVYRDGTNLQEWLQEMFAVSIALCFFTERMQQRAIVFSLLHECVVRESMLQKSRNRVCIARLKGLKQT